MRRSARSEHADSGVPHANPAPTLSFVIPVRNDAQRLDHCLASIAADAGTAPHEVIVVDNVSVDDSTAVASRHGAIVTSMPGSVAELRNAGVARARGALIAFVDADHRIASGWVSAALAALAAPDVGGAGAPYHAPEDGTWVQRTYDGLRRHPQRIGPAEWFGAGNLVVRRDAFDRIGGFDTSLESCEDVDLCARLRAAGWQLLTVPAMRTVHYGDPPTLARLFKSELWRGRDNLRVSLRAPWSIRNAASMAIPIVQLLAIPLAVLGTLRSWWLGLAILAVPLALLGVRTLALVRNTGGANPGGVPAALAVAAAFDAGRALALVARAGHHRRVPASPSTT
jgi:cellulose synthase/poly-beta-1,6-N-acetylglucosamine synthase-like glycosyltransferase